MTAPLALVTGATGFLGRHLLPLLAARGHRVRALVRSEGAAAIARSLGAEPVRGDVTEPASLPPAVADAETVFHLAGAITSGRRAFPVNAVGTRNLVRAVAATAPDLRRLVLVSSRAAVGPSRDGAPLGEATPPRPTSAYGESKLAAERIVDAECAAPWVVIRPPLLYGPGDRLTRPLFRLAAAGWFLHFAGGPRRSDLLHVRDAARAAALAGDRPGVEGRSILLAGPEPVTPARFRRTLARAAGRRLRTLAVPAALLVCAAEAVSPVLGRCTALDLAHARTDADPAEAAAALGFRAEVPLAAGVAEVMAGHRPRAPATRP